MKYTPIEKKNYIESRKRFEAQMKPNSLAIFNSNDEEPKNGDQTFVFRQHSDLFYLTGIDQEQTILILFPDSPLPQYKQILFLRKTSEKIAIWEGHKYTFEEAKEASGIESVYWVDDFNAILPVLMHHSENVYLNTNENDRYAHSVEYRDLRFIHQLQEVYPLHNYQRSAPIMAGLRAVKSADEIKQLQTACDITNQVLVEDFKMKITRIYIHQILGFVGQRIIRNHLMAKDVKVVADGLRPVIMFHPDGTLGAYKSKDSSLHQIGKGI